MTPLPLSVIVVSRHRAAALRRCILGLRQQDYMATEVIVVADPAGIAALGAVGADLKCAAFDDANISAARNLGLSMAAGAVVAFVDDDAVPEPTWASRLITPFSDANVVAATGFVRGRNGISYQWRSTQIDATGQDHPMPLSMQTSVHTGTPTRAVKTQGTNCAFRADALRQIGGFDPAFRFFLDEADVNLRLAPLGGTAIVPMAQVHHGYLASDRRRKDRVPLDLTEIAASTAVFLRRHAPDHLDAGLARLIADQRARALRHMIAGRIEPRDVRRLLATAHSGWAEGLARSLGRQQPLHHTPAPFRALPGLGPRLGVMIAGRTTQRAALMAQAMAAAASGQIATVLCLSPGWARHVHRFTDDGVWLQTGGLWGKADRAAPRPGPVSLAERQRTESRRLADFRPF